MKKVNDVFEVDVANDQGNNAGKMSFNDDGHEYPNVNALSKVIDGKNLNVNIEKAVQNLRKNVNVTTMSTAINKNGTYVVGELALEQKIQNSMLVGRHKKYESDLPIVNTLAQISVYAVQERYKQLKELPEEIKVVSRMATVLPVLQYTTETARQFKEKFLNYAHDITVHLSGHSVKVQIKFTEVYVLPESTPPLEAMSQIDILKMYINEKILCVDIGDGTTEYVFFENGELKKQFNDGSNNGVGHAIKEVINEINSEIDVSNSNRQHISNVIKNKNDYDYDVIMGHLKVPLDNQANQISQVVDSFITEKLRNRIDTVFVYGGGSIPLKEPLQEYIQPMLEEKKKGIKLVFCPEEYATKLNVLGLNELLKGE